MANSLKARKYAQQFGATKSALKKLDADTSISVKRFDIDEFYVADWMIGQPTEES